LISASSAPSLIGAARARIVDPDNAVFLTGVSAWEIAVKQAIGKLELSDPAVRHVSRCRKTMDVSELGLDEASALQIDQLPTPHNDSFNRMLVCQAIVHGLTIISPDTQISRYPVPVAW
jgi:PIN domain nuclease of toxin-antitoxin system